MISDNILKMISEMFIGNISGFYSYKTGPQLVAFFNQYYGVNERYASGFPSRWIYVQDKLKHLMAYNNLESFFSIILDRSYLKKDLGISEVEAAEKSDAIIEEINKFLSQDKYMITHKGNEVHLIQESQDLVFLGVGGFARVYKQLSTGFIVKKLKDEFLSDKGIRSRFKREFNITNSLKDLNGVITVFSFDESGCQYTMEEAETTLEKFIFEHELNDSIKEKIICQILTIMSDVHKRDIIHRDISPNNIFIISGQLKIADFGLGKDLNVFTSHQTVYTNAVGQYYYCAPEQFMMLKDADKRSDVYSLGRIINFVMTKSPNNFHHIFRSVAEKSTCADSVYRYSDATQLLIYFECAVQYNNDKQNEERVLSKIKNKVYDDDVESYIYNLSSEQLSKTLLKGTPGFKEVLLKFMDTNDEQAQHIIQNIEQSFKDVCKGSFESNDVFAAFAESVLIGSYSYVVKEIAAIILRYIAWDVHRFNAQHRVEALLDYGIEPMLEDIIKQ